MPNRLNKTTDHEHFNPRRRREGFAKIYSEYDSVSYCPTRYGYNIAECRSCSHCYNDMVFTMRIDYPILMKCKKTNRRKCI